MRKLISATLIAAGVCLSMAGAAAAYDGEQFVVCNLNPDGDNFLALRACGSSDCAMLDKLGPGTFLITMEPSATKGWREVIVQRSIQDWSYDGPSGWVYGKYICRIDYP
ncbi:hypothetical protein [Aliiroseovarius crassostreae]|uniref:hypothetical protein n=1 Tax=Aliiroseovarius crassostreae TaxID=154981 RepID=UPI003C7D6065